jgi:hypothetical protein
MHGLTIGESKRLMLKFIDEFSNDGQLIAEHDNLDYLRRHNAFADLAQSSLAQLFPLARVYRIQQQALNPLLAAGGFGNLPKEPGEDAYLAADATGAYYCELAGHVKLQVEENAGTGWLLLTQVEHQSPQTAAYKGNLPPATEGRRRRLRFSSNFPCTISNAVLYRPSFATEEEVPDFRPWRRYQMPDDFLRLDEVVVEQNRRYDAKATYQWQNDNVLILPHSLTAQLEVRYWAYPPKIGDHTPDDYCYPLAPEVVRLIPLRVAALVIPTERADLSLRLLQLYEQELLRLQNRQQTPGHRQVQSLYRMM